MASLSLPDLAGLVGVGLLLLAYALLQGGRLEVRAPLYSLLNLVGSGLILVSLVFAFNLPSAIIEGSWALISLYGLGIALARRRAAGEGAEGGGA